MEDIKFKLEKGNPVLVTNAVTKLLAAVFARHKQENQDTEEIPELSLLWEQCTSPNPTIAVTCCQALITLVTEGIAELPTTLTGLLTLLPRVRSVAGIVIAVGNLLALHVKNEVEQNKTYTCPFGIRSAQHPFVTILKQCPEAWPHVLDGIKVLMDNEDTVVYESSCELLKPVLLFILGSPDESPQRASCRLALKAYLLQLQVFRRQDTRITELLIEMVTWLQFEGEQKLFENALFLQDFAHNALFCEDISLTTTLTPSLAALVLRLVKHGQNPAPCLHHLHKLLELNNSSASVVLVLLAQLITECPPIHFTQLLQICRLLIDTEDVPLLVSEMLIVSLLQMLAFPSRLTSEASGLASDLIWKVYNTPLTKSSKKTHVLYQNRLFRKIQSSDHFISFAMELSKLGRTLGSSPSITLAWLQRLKKENPHSLHHLFPFVAALFLHRYNEAAPQVVLQSLGMLMTIVENSTLYGPVVLTLLLHRLSMEGDYNIQLELIHALPKMASHKSCVALVLQTVDSLKNLKSLQTLRLHLLLQLWHTEDRTYSYLQETLCEEESGARDQDQFGSWEYQVAKAAAIKEICKLRPQRYGADLLKPLSQILQQSSTTAGAVSAGLALEGLCELCQASVVDICTVWKVLAPKLSKNKSPLVIARLCKLLGLVPQLHVAGKEYANFMTDVLNRLWKYALTYHSPVVVTAALEALAQFKLEHHQLKMFSEDCRQGLKLPASYCKTPVEAARKPEDVLPYVPRECWLQLFRKVPPGELVSALVRQEIVDLPHSLYHQKGQAGRAATEPRTYSYLPENSVLCGIIDFLVEVSQRRRGDKGQDVVRTVEDCLDALGQPLSRHFPPLDWTLLQGLLELGEEMPKKVVRVAAKQAATSRSARMFLQTLLSTSLQEPKQELLIKAVYCNLVDICKGVPPASTQPFLNGTLSVTLTKITDAESSEDVAKERANFVERLAAVQQALKADDIHDANRTAVGVVVEGLLHQINIEDEELFSAFLDCAAELTTKNLERMSSPSLWWEVTPEKLHKAIRIRSTLAQKGEGESPLVWMNDCIEAAAGTTGDETLVLRYTTAALVACHEKEANKQWLLELMGHIRSLLLGKLRYETESQKQHALSIFCDVFIMAVIVLSGLDMVQSDTEKLVVSREKRLSLLPLAVGTLLKQDSWKSAYPKFADWLYELCINECVPQQYRGAFQLTLPTLRQNVQFSEPRIWSKLMSVKVC